MRTDELDFELPPELIAQAPSARRSSSRLLHYRRDDRSIAHRTFAELPTLLRAGDLMVFNNARVIPARFTLRKETGGLVEALFVGLVDACRWRVLLKNLGPWSDRSRYAIIGDDQDAIVQIIDRVEAGEFIVSVSSDESPDELLERVGRMPLPPYIRREKVQDERDAMDVERYQTVYASASGSIAAPTAGLHFSDALLRELDSAGVERATVTLNVGLGTFKPVLAETLETHPMHRESYSIPSKAIGAIRRSRDESRRVIAVGTTSARVLESQTLLSGESQLPESNRYDGETSICIYPPYEWKFVDALITNFHLPRSTLIALVAAMIGLEEQRRIYRIAIEERYRFFSYGDAMFIE